MKKELLSFALACSSWNCCAAPPTAVFDFFSYTGQDEFYDRNPLSGPEYFYNPIVPGWYSDPSICRVGADYYMVMSTFGYFPGVPLFHSVDLVNWELKGNILCRPSQLPGLPGQSVDRGGIYAPDLTYNPANRTFYLITTDVGKGNFYVTAKDPAGPWSDPVWLPTIRGIDPAFFFDDDGQAYIIHKEDVEGQPKWNNHRALRIARFDTETGQTVGEETLFREEGVGPEERLDRDEGPHLYKINGFYYVIAAEGGTGSNHSEVVYRSRSVLGPYQRWARNPMLTQRMLKPTRPHAVTCAGHADLVDTPNGEWWAVFLGCRPIDGSFENLGRETFLMPVNWSADGFPWLTQSIDTIPLMLRRNGVTRSDSPTFGNFTWRDAFRSPRLRPEWLSPWAIDSACIQVGNGLRLIAAAHDAAARRPFAYIGRRMQHHQFTAETSLRLTKGTRGAAGILLFKNESHQYFLAVSSKGVTLRRTGKDGDQTLAFHRQPVSGTVSLRVVSTGKTYGFFYRLPHQPWTLLTDNIDAGFLATRSAGGFTGTTIGLCAKSD